MAKRHAEDILISSSPSKRCRGHCSVDMRLESMAPSRGVSPPSLLALLGSRCRKRHFYFDETDKTDLDLVLFRKGTHGNLLKHTAHLNTVQQQTSGNFLERRIIAKSTNKRAREDSEAPADTANPKAKVEVDADTTNNEDNSYNSFQFWRTPLPELDMSLLQECPQKDSSDAMET